jgi:hypothetical protein
MADDANRKRELVQQPVFRMHGVRETSLDRKTAIAAQVDQSP